MSTIEHPIEPWAANLILMGVDRLDNAITALGCVMRDLQGDPESARGDEIGALSWMYCALRGEAENIRESIAMAQNPRVCRTRVDAGA